MEHTRAGSLRRIAASCRGRELHAPDDLFELLEGAADTISLTVIRGTDELTVAVTFASEESSADS